MSGCLVSLLSGQMLLETKFNEQKKLEDTQDKMACR